MSLAAFDSTLLNNYLQCRRMWFKAGKPAIWTQPTAQCLAVASNFAQPLMGTLIGTNVTLQSDIDALRDIATVMTVDPNSITPNDENAYGSWSTLGTWSAFATNFSIDPCVQRLAGLYCEKGRIVAVNLENLGVKGILPDSWGNMTMIRFINLAFGNQFGGLTGHVPHSMTKLVNLQNLILDDNKLLSLPEHIGNLTNLLVLRVRLNLLSALPESFGDLQSLVVLDISVNAFQFSPSVSSAVATTRSNVSQATALLQVFKLSSILDMNLQDNSLFLNCSHVNFHSFMQVEKLILTNISMFGEFALDAFDGLSTLNLIDLSNNKIEGAIPAFNNCHSLSSFAISNNLLRSPLPLFSAKPPSLSSISLDHNFFYGELPQEWIGLESLSTIFLSNNQLQIGNLRTLRSMKNVQHVDLSHNQIYIDPYYNGDLGFFLWETMSLTLVSLNLNYNQLNGKFSSGWMDKVLFTSLSMANNQLQSLPSDLFDSALISIDISNNQLSGAFPSSPPRMTVDLREYNPVTFINFQNNSNFLNHLVSSSPRSLGWIVQTSPTEYIQKNQMLCPKLTSQSSVLTLLVDPGFIGWSKCVCAPLTTGSPPTCKPIPALLSISPFRKPQLDATSNSNTDANAPTSSDISNLLMLNPWFQLDGNTMHIQLVDNRTVPSLDTLNTNASLPAFTQLWPPSFSDAWYYKPPLDAGSTADSLSLSTSWKINLDSIRWDVRHQLQVVDEFLWDSTLSSQISPSSDVPQPVRVITLLLHISRVAFGDSDILDVYNSQLNLVTRLEKKDLYNNAHPNYYNASIMLPNWGEYMRVYGKALSTLSEYVTMRIQIAGNAANIVLNSIDRPVVRFVATYSYAFDCSTLPVTSRIVLSDSGYQCLFDSPSSYLPFEQTGFECKGQVDPLNSNSLLQLEDPAALNYHDCRCSIGKFGNPPICDLIPVTSVLSPVAEPHAANPSLSNYSFMALNPTLVQSAASISSITTNSSGPLPWHRMISDSWFGSTRRFSAGFSSSWIIDLQRFRQGPSQSPIASDEESSVAIYTDFSPVASTIIGPSEVYQPVRSITIRVHVDAAAFAGASNTLSVFVGNSSSGDRKLFLNGDDPSFRSCPTLSPFTSSLEYQTDYSAALSKFTTPPCLFEVMVLSNQASIFFSSRDADSSHFLATYSYQFGVCPGELVIDPTTNMCLQKFTLSSAAPSAVYATAAITCAWILLQLLFLGLKWTAPIYRASSRPFLLLQIGLLLTLAASSVLYAEVPTPNSTSGNFICLGRAWFTGISITGLLAVLLSKTLRVYRLFSNAILARRVDVSDQSILKTVVAITLIQVVLLLIFSGVPVSKPVVKHGLGILSDQLVASCSDDSAGFWPVMILEFIFIFSLIVVSLGLAFKTRNTPSAFNDNTQIFQCLISIFVLSIFVIALVLWLARADPDAAVFLQGIGQCLFAFVMTCWLLFPKAFVALTTTVEEQKAMAETYASTSGPKTSLPSNTKSTSNTSKSTPGGSNSTSAKPGTGVIPNGVVAVPRPLPAARPSVIMKAPLPQLAKKSNPPSPAIVPSRPAISTTGSPKSAPASPSPGAVSAAVNSPAVNSPTNTAVSPSAVRVILAPEEPKSSAPNTPATKALIPVSQSGEDSSNYSLSTSPVSNLRRINDGSGAEISEPMGTLLPSSSAAAAVVQPMSPSNDAPQSMQSIPTAKMLDALSQIESASFFVQRLKVRLKSANGQVSPEAAAASTNANGL